MTWDISILKIEHIICNISINLYHYCAQLAHLPRNPLRTVMGIIPLSLP